MAAPAPGLVPLREPLRLPHGSVRGFLALALTSTFALLVVRDSTAPAVLVNAVVVSLAFYFGTRVATPPPASAAGATPVPAVRPPRILRALLFVGFGVLTASFPILGKPLPPVLVQVLEVLAGYVAGLALSWVFHHRAHENVQRRRLAILYRDLSAGGALALTVFACVAFAVGLAGTMGTLVEQALSLVITYYFGSRVLAH